MRRGPFLTVCVCVSPTGEDFYDIGVMALRIYAIILQNLKAARGDSLAARLDEAYMPFMHFCKVASPKVKFWFPSRLLPPNYGDARRRRSPMWCATWLGSTSIR